MQRSVPIPQLCFPVDALTSYNYARHLHTRVGSARRDQLAVTYARADSRQT